MGEYKHEAHFSLPSAKRSLSLTPLTEYVCHSGTTDIFSVHSDFRARSTSEETRICSAHVHSVRQVTQAHQTQPALLTECYSGKDPSDFYMDRRLSDSSPQQKSMNTEDPPLSRGPLAKMPSDSFIRCHRGNARYVRRENLIQNSCENCDNPNKRFLMKSGNSDSNIMYMNVRTEKMRYFSDGMTIPDVDFVSLPGNASDRMDSMGIWNPANSLIQTDQPSEADFCICGPNCDEIDKICTLTYGDIFGGGIRDNKPEVNDRRTCESVEMTDSINTLHICKPKCRGTPLQQHRHTPDRNGRSCIRSNDFHSIQEGDQFSMKVLKAITVNPERLLVGKLQSEGQYETYRKYVSDRQVVSTCPCTCIYDSDLNHTIAKEITSQRESEIVPRTSVENSSEPLLAEDLVWVKRTNTGVNLQSEITDTTVRSRRGREPITNVSRQPVILMLLTLIGSLLNPVFAPAGIYFLIRSKRSWSQRRYQSAYRYSYQAGGIAITGIIVTITSLVLLLLTVFPRNQMETITASQIRTTTSNENQDRADIRFAGERFLETIIGGPSSHIHEKQSSIGRHIKRTTSPRHLYTKIRHSTHRFGNVHISDLDKFMEHVTPTETTETTRAKHLIDFLNEDVAKRKPHLTFRNRTMSVYFDPKKNRTIIVNIPESLQ